MNKFNINKVIEAYNLDLESTAKVLFPRVKYPKAALDRILKGEASLDVEQLEALAAYIGVVVTDLFGLESWKGVSENGKLVLLKGPYKVVFNYEETLINVFKNTELVFTFIAPVKLMTVNQFITELDNQLKQFENGNN